MGSLCSKPKIDFAGEVNLFHFSLQRIVGKGAFGKVRVVQHKQTHDVYALKYINKEECVKMGAVQNVIQERRLLEKIDHPFIVNMRYAFQDDENCFFVLDLMLGGDLHFHLAITGSFPEHTVQFYVAQLTSAVAFLHEMGIVHRDLKPDNILLDSRGNAHLTDFNIATHFGEGKVTGVAGTVAYMAPEVLLGVGYTCDVDWWSLGACAYELVFGCQPFVERPDVSLPDIITREPLQWPEGADCKCSRSGILAIQGLLERDPSLRLGSGRNKERTRDLQRHPWLENVDWSTLHKKEQRPPFTPNSDKSNFDATYELGELLLGDSPLRAKERKAVSLSTLSAEMRQMEDQFTTYDFRKVTRDFVQFKREKGSTTATGMSSTAKLSRTGTETGSYDTGDAVRTAVYEVQT